MRSNVRTADTTFPPSSLPILVPDSPLADTALLASTIAAGIGLIGTLVATIFALMRGDLAMGLFWGPIACLIQMGILVVFLRVQD